MDAILQDDNAESFCEVIIDTLKTLRLNEKQVTPKVLHQALFEKQIYRYLLNHKSLADSSLDFFRQPAVEIQGDSSNSCGRNLLRYSQIKKLQDFRISLLDEYTNSLPNEFLASASKVRELVGSSNEVDQILELNDKILDILRAATGRSRGELEQFTSLAKELGKDLAAMESDLITSFFSTRETFENNKAFNNTLAKSLEDTKEAVDISINLVELKGFVTSALATIKEALAQKYQYDQFKLKKATVEVEKLRKRLAVMKQEIVRVQRKAKALEEETLRDPLTDVHNRRAYERRIQEELACYERSEEVFSILMIDIDHFKSINDNHGHWVGDRCLEELGKLIKKVLRGTDFLARYGGEEFIAILPGTAEQGIRIVAEKLRMLIERTRFHFHNEEIPLTVSIGGTAIRSSDENAEAIFKRVDTAMYEAKKTGRNRAVIL